LIENFESRELRPSDFYLWGWMDREIYKSKVGNPAELLQRILDAAARIKKREDQLRKKNM